MARKAETGDRGKKKGENPAKAPALPADADLPTSFNEPVGNGGETHQIASGGVATMTTQQGVPIADDQNSLKAGPRGPDAARGFHPSREDLPLRS